jgi:hypothetical protein
MVDANVTVTEVVTVRSAAGVVGMNGRRRTNRADGSVMNVRSVVDATEIEARGVKNVPNAEDAVTKRMKRLHAKSVPNVGAGAMRRMNHHVKSVSRIVRTVGAVVEMIRMTKTTRARTIRGPTARAARIRSQNRRGSRGVAEDRGIHRRGDAHPIRIVVTTADAMIRRTGHACVPMRTVNLGVSAVAGGMNVMNLHVRSAGVIAMMIVAAIGTTGTAIPRIGVNSKVAGNANLWTRQVKNCSSRRGRSLP